MIRVARRKVFLTIAWFRDGMGSKINTELHINRHDEVWWMAAIKEALTYEAGWDKCKPRVIEVRGEWASFEIEKP